MDKPTIIIQALLALFLTSCWGKSELKNDNKKQVDEFYTITGGWDWIRVPLLKPYEAKKIDPEIETNTWTIKFFNSLGPFSIKRIDVKDSIVYLLCGKMENENKEDSTLVNLRNVPTGWFAIDVRTKSEKGFSNETEFNEYILQNKYPLPEWHDIDSLSRELANGGKVPWIPE